MGNLAVILMVIVVALCALGVALVAMYYLDKAVAQSSSHPDTVSRTSDQGG